MIVNQICKFSDTSSDLAEFKKKMQSVFSEGPPPTQTNNPLLAAERIMIALLAEYKEVRELEKSRTRMGTVLPNSENEVLV